MTRKDYVALAEAIAGEYPVDIGNQLQIRITDWHGMALAIANVLAADNPRFDRDRFVKACQGKK